MKTFCPQCKNHFYEHEYSLHGIGVCVPNNEKPVQGLWRYQPDTPEGKYLVCRRDGTVVEWPNFTLGAKDPCSPAALRVYADEAEKRGLFPQYVSDIRQLADEFEEYRLTHGEGDPDRGKHRVDDPVTIEKMKKGRSV